MFELLDLIFIPLSFFINLIPLLIVFLLPALVALLPLSLFLMTVKVFNLIRRNKYSLATITITITVTVIVIIAILAVVGRYYNKVVFSLVNKDLAGIIIWWVYQFFSGVILLLLALYLVSDIFFKKGYLTQKKAAVGALIA